MSKASGEITRILQASDDSKVSGELHQWFNRWELTSDVESEIALIEARFNKPIFAANPRWIERVFSGEDEPRMRLCNKFIVTGAYAFKVRGKKLGDEHFENMGRADHLGGVTYYASVVNASMGPRTFNAFANAKTLVNLGELDLSYSKPGKEGMAALGAASSLAKVARLALISCALKDAAVQAFCAGRSLESLTKLSLARNPISAKGAAALGASPMLARLTSLDLNDCSLDDNVLGVLARGEQLAGLQQLKIDYNNALTDKACETLATASFARSLDTLDLTQLPLNAQSLGVLLRACPSITSLRAGYTGLSSVAPLVEHEAGFSLLSLDNCAIDADGVKALVAAPWFKKLTSLALADCPIGEAGYRTLATTDLSSLELLSVTGRGATADAWAALVANPTLRPEVRDPLVRLSQYVR